jgi:hypothetical protein
MSPTARRTLVTAAVALLVVAAGAALRTALPTTRQGAAPASTLQVSRAAEPAVVVLGGWTFTPPPGYAVAGPRETRHPARFGPQGLVNDDAPLGPRDMRVTIETQFLQGPDGAKLFVTQIRPEPTVAHPGPRPAADPRDPVAAARTMVDVLTSLGVDEDVRRPAPGLPVGPATLVRYDETNGILVARPVGPPPQVLLFEVGRSSVEVAVAVARSARR